MLNWIDKNERLPTEKDSGGGNNYVYALGPNNLVYFMRFYNLGTCTHWLPFHEMPLPKRWRVPTIHDLAKAGKPIPCRVRDTIAQEWKSGELCAIDVQINYGYGRAFMGGSGSWHHLCEIEE